MARCGCSGSTCSCLVTAGSGVAVSGTGTEANPYVIDVVGSDIAGTFAVADTSTVDMNLAGSGSTADPYVLSATATLALTALSDITSGDVPASGDVPVWNGSTWDFQPPPTTPPGAVNVGAGLSGDGSAPAPLAVATSGTWGVAPLDSFGSNTLLGAPTYIDSNGQVRTLPRGIDIVADGVRPDQYPGRVIVESGTQDMYWSNGTTWIPVVDDTAVYGHAGLTQGFVPVPQGGQTLVPLPVSAQALNGGVTFNTSLRQLVVPVDGLYQITTHMYGSGTSSGWMNQRLRLTTNPAGNSVFAVVQMHKNSTNDVTGGASALVRLPAGAGVYMQGISSAAGFQAWGTTGFNGSYMEVLRVGSSAV